MDNDTLSRFQDRAELQAIRHVASKADKRWTEKQKQKDAEKIAEFMADKTDDFPGYYDLALTQILVVFNNPKAYTRLLAKPKKQRNHENSNPTLDAA